MTHLCICESGLPARRCCRTITGWRKKPLVVRAGDPPTGISNDHCYLACTADCSDEVSRDHHVPRSILKQIDPTAVMTAGYRWLDGEVKPMALEALQSRVLCRSHNSKLSGIDDVGARFYAAIRQFRDAPRTRQILLSGHDLERFILKCGATLLAARNATFQGAILDCDLVDWNVISAALLQNRWNDGAGLMTVAAPQVLFAEGIEIAPIAKAYLDEPGPPISTGLRMTFAGLPVAVTWDHWIELDGVISRPRRLLIPRKGKILSVEFSWERGVPVGREACLEWTETDTRPVPTSQRRQD